MDERFCTVMFPIRVPVGDYCWEYNGGAICSHFNNEGGPAVCTLGFDIINLTRTLKGVEKPKDCKCLKNWTP